jgi:hypothetical protein
VLTATHVAKKLGRDFDGVSKHLRLMRETGVICSIKGEDKRYEWFCIPKKCRCETGTLDFGWCRISIS